jgi:DNA polymerase-3 subunit beta
MKIVISKQELMTLIGRILSVVSNKPAIPILSHVLMEAYDDQLIISATDLTVSMRYYCEAKILEEGAIALPARRFFQLIKELTSPQIKISTLSNEMAEITAGSALFKLNCMVKSEFPNLPDLNHCPQFTLPSQALKKILSSSSFSAAKEDNRFVLNGVLLKIEDQKATFLATDGKRLSKVCMKVDIDASFQGAYIIPLKAVEEMIKILDGHDETNATISLMSDKISLEQGSLTLMTKLFSGQFPQVEKVIPQNITQVVPIHREELMILLRQVALFTSEDNNSVRFFFEVGKLHLSAVSNEIGEGKVDMPVDYTGSAMEIAFNPFYFQDILRHCLDEIVKLSLCDPYNPGTITDSSGALYVIMPMHLQEVAEPAEIEEQSVTDSALT